jgi:regulatory protein
MTASRRLVRDAAGRSQQSAPGHSEDDLGDPQDVARAICLRLLDSRARSRNELAGALRTRGVPDEDACVVLDRYAELGLIDDDELARALVADRHRDRGLGRRALLRELDRRGIDPQLADRAASVIDPEAERTRAAELVRKRLPRLAGVPALTRDRRLVALLMRKGYEPALVFEVVRQECRDALERTYAPD